MLTLQKHIRIHVPTLYMYDGKTCRKNINVLLMVNVNILLNKNIYYYSYIFL